MLFHSLNFAVFFTLAFFGHWLLVNRRTPHRLFLAGMSLWFYAAWNAYYVILIFVSTTIDFVAAERIHATQDPRRRKAWLLASLAGNLGLLGTFKYYGFFVTSIHDLTGFVGMPIALPTLELLLPVGISFYTFQSLSYTIDVYRKRIPPARNYLELFLFVIFFPQLVAGPIVRAAEFLPQFEKPPSIDKTDVGFGFYRILRGLIKKVVIADYLGRTLVDPAFLHHDATNPWMLLLGVYAFAFQLYGDFSGYSDIAIGAARLLGYRFPENFQSPFRSVTFREFWTRWHITLGTWFRDYVFAPLGSYRKGRLRGNVNLIVTLFLAGLWHGAAWTFVLFGLYIGVMMLYQPIRRGKRYSAATLWFWRLVAFQLFAVGFLLFRASSLEMALGFAGRIASGIFRPEAGREALGILTSTAMRGPLLAFVFVGLTQTLTQKFRDRVQGRFASLPLPVILLGSAGGLGLVMALYSSQAPFIYFQF